MSLETKELAKLLVNSQNRASHPDGPGRRLVGYVISDEHYPSDGLFALQHISNVFNSHDRLTAEVARLRDVLHSIHLRAELAEADGVHMRSALGNIKDDAAKALNLEEPK